MRVNVDHEKCMGTGNCTLIAPHVFGTHEDGLVLLQVESPGWEHLAAVRRAVESCPTGAISVEEDGDDG